MKDSNKKFQGFAHNLIAESLRKWASHSKFVAAKLEQRLRAPIDELDEKIAEVIFNGEEGEKGEGDDVASGSEPKKEEGK
mmetsp:Transcript_16669/g.25701  ORF Transcript_16669/g.25701 Transcript_16669/m.25701 type:complete len:80 (+) Transcript_16669:827-1066(+)